MQVADAEKAGRLSAEEKVAAETRARQVQALEFSSNKTRLLEQLQHKQLSSTNNQHMNDQAQQLLTSEIAQKETEILGRKTAEGELTKERLNVLTMGRHLSSEAEQR